MPLSIAVKTYIHVIDPEQKSSAEAARTIRRRRPKHNEGKSVPAELYGMGNSIFPFAQPIGRLPETLAAVRAATSFARSDIVSSAVD